MTNMSKCDGNGQPKLKYELQDTGWVKLQKVKPQISGFPQQELIKNLNVGLMESDEDVVRLAVPFNLFDE